MAKSKLVSNVNIDFFFDINYLIFLRKVQFEQ